MSTPSTVTPDSFRQAIRDAVIDLGDGDTKVVDADLTQVDDLLDTPTWQVTLYLPRPTQGRWSVDATRALRRAVRNITDTLAVTFGEALDGLTSVVLATRDAPESATAAIDRPEEAEVATSEEETPS